MSRMFFRSYFMPSREIMKPTSAERSSGVSATGRQMRVLNDAYFFKGTATQPSPIFTSISCGLSMAGRVAWSSVSGIWSPAKNAACDQVDWVRYLIAAETFWLPSISRTSPGRSVRASVSWSDGV
ncbi:hypothetical protein D9M72_608520 [compost metagenome]